MPRKNLKLDQTLQWVSVLDEKGKLDKHLEPDISDEELLKIHRFMLLGRRFDQRLLKLQRQGRIGTFAPVEGQEACQIGAMAPLKPQDWFVPA
ncbi:MAG: thiamine pyrophosphate-dependent enzyme, partial [Candidatus Competibacteraceae bacterium]|nr:thiamine pyrophosphate-dependent enzyme [Candidatus Competibacteraceae bacterium]